MVPVHAAPEVDGRLSSPDAPFRHYGEFAVSPIKVDKVNRYSSGLVDNKRGKARVSSSLGCCTWGRVPKLYFGKRYHRMGRASAAKTQSFYAFLKYTKVLEAQRQSREYGRRAFGWRLKRRCGYCVALRAPSPRSH